MKWNTYNEIGVTAMYKAMEYNNSLLSLSIAIRNTTTGTTSDDNNNNNDDDVIFYIMSMMENSRPYDTPITNILLRMLVSYNDTIRRIDDPKLPDCISEIMWERSKRPPPWEYCDYEPPIFKGCRQRNDIYHWIFQNY
jgi:hypothetical protein